MQQETNPIQPQSKPLSDNRVSVDCTVLGFDGDSLNVLLVRRNGEEGGELFHDMKLPGSLIYLDEDLDDAAMRVLHELTGLKNIAMTQFKAFGSKDRTKDPKDVHWLERATELHIDRIVTIAYIALLKIDRNIRHDLDDNQAVWVPIDKVGNLAFDHNQILKEAVLYMRDQASINLDLIYELLPKKFTILQVRKLYEVLHQVKLDAGNFYKKLVALPFIVPLDEKEEGKPHKPARLYRFDKKLYRKTIVK